MISSSPTPSVSAAAWKQRSQFLRFVIVGAGGTGLHYAVLWSLVIFGNAAPALSAFAGATVGAAFNYWLNRRFTFDSTRPHRKAVPLFVVVAAGSAVLNGFIVGSLSQHGLHFMLAQVVATAVVLVLNFVISKKWIFLQSK